MMKHKIAILLLCVFALLATSCQQDGPDTPEAPAKRTILVYMVASNSLGSNGRDQMDLDEMDRAVELDELNGCRLLVYRIGPEEDIPLLFEIKKGKRGAVLHETLEAYDGTRGASVTAARMSQVIADAKRHAPAQDYGLILWSHGTGWAPSLTTRAAAPRRVFGEDNGSTMALDQLAAAIPVGAFSWIYADVCYMGGIEVAYQLRNRCRYFVGYPTEIPGRGMPYELTLPHLCADQAQLAQACEETFNYYDIQTGANRTFSAVVVDCSYLDQLAATCRLIQATSPAQPSLSTLQCYNLNGYHFLYDFMQYYLEMADMSLGARMQDIYEKAVLYRISTPMIFNRIMIDQENFSGLSTYVLGTSPGVNDNYYRTLDWFHAVY
jgi:hypothetical protein